MVLAVLPKHCCPHVTAVKSRVAVIVGAEHGEITRNSRAAGVVDVEPGPTSVRRLGADCCGGEGVHFGRKLLIAPEHAAGRHDSSVQRGERQGMQRFGRGEAGKSKAFCVPNEFGAQNCRNLRVQGKHATNVKRLLGSINNFF